MVGMQILFCCASVSFSGYMLACSTGTNVCAAILVKLAGGDVPVLIHTHTHTGLQLDEYKRNTKSY